MSPVAIRIPDEGETPLSLAEQRIAQQLGVKPKRHYAQRFWWREPVAPAPRPAPARAYRTDLKGSAA